MDAWSADGSYPKTESLKPGLPVLRGVAGPHVAAGLAEDGRDVARVADLRMRNRRRER